MKNILIKVACLAVLFGAFSLEASQAEAKSPSRSARVVKEYLDEHSDYRDVSFDSDGDISFRNDDGVFLVIFDEDEPQFFVLSYPNFWEIDDRDEFDKADRCAKYVSNKVKAARIYVPDAYEAGSTNLSSRVELFCSDASEFCEVIPKSVQAAFAAAKLFGIKMLAESL